MPRVLADRVKETTTTTGTGTVNLAGAVSGFQGFVAGIESGNQTYYAIVHQTLAEWEVGEGTVTDATPDTLSRTTVFGSSNAGALVNFSAGTKDVFVTGPGQVFAYPRGLRETGGPTLLTLGAVTDGQYLKRTGSTVVGDNGAVFVGTSPPSSPVAGALWWNSEEGTLKIYYVDANTSQWVDAVIAAAGPPASFVRSLAFMGA